MFRNDAKDVLVGFNLTDAQYHEAVKQLKEKYDDKEYIIHSHYTTLSKLPISSNITSED